MALRWARSIVLSATSAAALIATPPLEEAHADRLPLAAGRAAAVIEGVVLLPDGKPAAGARVALGGYAPRELGAKRGWSWHQRDAVADARGRFQFLERDGASLSGELRLGLWARTADGGLAAVRDVSRAGAFSLQLAPAKTLEVEPARVRSAPPAAGAADVFHVQVKTATGTLRTSMAVTAGSGLSFEGVPPGSFVVEIQSWCASPGAPCAGAIARGQIDADGATTVRRVPMAIAPYGVAEGVAIDPATRARIAGAPITCDDGPCAWDVDGFWPPVSTTPDGRYRISGLAPGPHVLRFGDRVTVTVDVAPLAPQRAPAIAR